MPDDTFYDELYADLLPRNPLFIKQARNLMLNRSFLGERSEQDIAQEIISTLHSSYQEVNPRDKDLTSFRDVMSLDEHVGARRSVLKTARQKLRNRYSNQYQYDLGRPSQEVLDQAIILPNEVANELAGFVSTATQSEYRKIFPGDPELTNIKNVARGSQFSSEREQIFQNARAYPLRTRQYRDYGATGEKVFGAPPKDKSLLPTYNRKVAAFNRGASLIRSASTVGDVMDILMYASIPEAATGTASAIEKKMSSSLVQEPGDVMSARLSGTMQSMLTYQPKSEEGKPRNFFIHSAWGQTAEASAESRAYSDLPGGVSMGGYDLETVGETPVGLELWQARQAETGLPQQPAYEIYDNHVLMNNLYSKTGEAFTRTGEVEQFSAPEPGAKPPEGWKSVRLSQRDISHLTAIQENRPFSLLSQEKPTTKILSYVMPRTSTGYSPTKKDDPNIAMLADQLVTGRQQWREISGYGAGEPVVYSSDPSELRHYRKMRAIANAPESIPTNLFYKSPGRPTRLPQAHIDPKRVTSSGKKQLYFSRSQLAHYGNINITEETSPNELMLIQEARRLTGQLVTPSLPGNPYGTSNAFEAEDIAETYAKDENSEQAGRAKVYESGSDYADFPPEETEIERRNIQTYAKRHPSAKTSNIPRKLNLSSVDDTKTAVEIGPRAIDISGQSAKLSENALWGGEKAPISERNLFSITPLTPKEQRKIEEWGKQRYPEAAEYTTVDNALQLTDTETGYQPGDPSKKRLTRTYQHKEHPVLDLSDKQSPKLSKDALWSGQNIPESTSVSLVDMAQNKKRIPSALDPAEQQPDPRGPVNIPTGRTGEEFGITPDIHETDLDYQGTYISGTDINKFRPQTASLRSEMIDRELEHELRQNQQTSNLDPVGRQTVRNIYGRHGNVGNPWQQLSPRDTVENSKLSWAGIYETRRADYMKRYAKYGSDRAQKFAREKMAAFAQRRIAKNKQWLEGLTEEGPAQNADDFFFAATQTSTPQAKQPEAPPSFEESDTIAARSQSIATPQSKSIQETPPSFEEGDMPQDIIPSQGQPPAPPEEPPPTIAGAEDEPWYARVGPLKTQEQLDTLTTRYQQYPENIQSSMQTLMTEYPEYVRSHLGKGEFNKKDYYQWRGELDKEADTKFGIAHQALRAEASQSAPYSGTSPFRFMLDVAGKKWVGYSDPSFASKAQENQLNSWVGTVHGGKIYINPEAKLRSEAKVISDDEIKRQTPRFIVDKLRTETGAVIAHEAGHLRELDLREGDITKFNKILEGGEARTASNLSEEFANQSMLHHIGQRSERWREFQKKNFPRFAEFFESIKGTPAMKKSPKVIYGTPKEFGPLSAMPEAELGPEDDPEEVMDQLRGGTESLPPTQRETTSGPLQSTYADQITDPQTDQPAQRPYGPSNDPSPKAAHAPPEPPEEPPPNESLLAENPNKISPNNIQLPTRKNIMSSYPGWITQADPSIRDNVKNWWRSLSDPERRAFIDRENQSRQAGIATYSYSEWKQNTASGEVDAQVAYARAHRFAIDARAVATEDPDIGSTWTIEAQYELEAKRPGAITEIDPRSQMPISQIGAASANLFAATRVKSQVLGKAQISRTPSTSGGSTVKGVRYVDEAGDVTLSEESTAQAVDIVQKSWGDIDSSHLPQNPTDMSKTLLARLNKAVKTHIDNIATDMEKAGVDPASTADYMAKISTVAGVVATKSVQRAVEDKTGTRPLYTNDKAVLLRSADEISRAAENVSEISDYLAEYNLTPQQAAKGQQVFITGGGEGGGGGSYVMGQGAYGILPPGNRPPTRTLSGANRIFGGPLGSTLYGAYIAKRFWSMTMAPELASMERYGQGMLATEGVSASGYGATGDLTSADAGWAMRQSRTQEYYAKGAYQMWGGFGDVAYSMTGGSGALARSKSGIMAGLAGVSAGYIAFQTAAATEAIAPLAGLSAGAGAIAPVALGLGATILTGTLAMEAYNAFNPDQPPVTWGNLARTIAANQYKYAAQEGIELDERQQALVDYQAPTEEFVKAERSLGMLEEITGEKKETIAPTWRALSRGTSGAATETGFARRIGAAIRESGMTTGEWGSMFSQYATSMGYAPGTSAYTRALQSFSAPGLTEADRQQMLWQSQLVARYAGSVSGYFTELGNAQRTVERYGIDTQTEAQSLQTLMAAGALGGLTGESTIGYMSQTGKPYQFKDWAGETSLRLGPTGVSVVSQMASDVISAGGDAMDAFGQAERAYNALGGAQAGKWAASLNSQLIASGADPRNSIAVSQSVAALGFSRYQLSTQLGQYLTSTGVDPVTAYTAAGQYRVQTAAQVSQIQNAVQTAQEYGYSGGQIPLTAAFASMQPYQGEMVNRVSPILYRAGLSNIQVAGIANQFSGWSAQQTYLAGQALSGNLRALSYMSWHGTGQGAAPEIEQQPLPEFAKPQEFQPLPQLTTTLPEPLPPVEENPEYAKYKRDLWSDFPTETFMEEKPPQYIPRVAGIRSATDKDIVRALYGNRQPREQGKDIGVLYTPAPIGAPATSISPMARAEAPQADTMLNNMKYRFYDLANNPIYETSFEDFWKMGQARAADTSYPIANKYFGSTIGQSFGIQATKDFFAANGVQISDENAKIWTEGNSRARTLEHNQRQYDNQMAGIGIAYQQLALQRNYLWGANQGGTWDSPAAGSMWAYQNIQRRMQYSQQMYQFGYQEKTMDTQAYFASMQEDLSARRMNISQDYQRWQTAFNYSGSLMQRAWTREDWQYQDTSRQMQFGWNLEDIEEGLRYAKGRERRQLLKQRERLVSSENLESGQIAKTRSRQEEVWAREDERYQKTVDYSEKMMALDKEQYELSRKQRLTMYSMEKEHLAHAIEEYKKEFKLQTQMIELEREHQAKSLELQEQSLGIQAAAAAESKTYADEMLIVSQAWSDMMGEAQQLAENDPTEALKLLKDFAIDLNAVSKDNITSLDKLMQDLNLPGVAASSRAIANVAERINFLDTTKMAALQALIDDLVLYP